VDDHTELAHRERELTRPIPTEALGTHDEGEEKKKEREKEAFHSGRDSSA